MDNELSWIAEARKYIGLREIPGPRSHSVIQGWLRGLKAWWSDDATAWCGTFVATCLQHSKLDYPKDWYRAKAYLALPTALDEAAYGCIVIFDRAGGGHVGFVVGKDRSGNLMVLGGNQGDEVCIKPFAVSRVVGYRWPNRYPSASRFILPVLNSDGKLSNNEA
jgi:uncharacterized protein (TIGR02594 family)